ncbi:hypothetical protein ECZU29_43760 [Escherichia coli]|nr:hypothetical protein ECZU29_43760 [Escherichia coli]
MLKLFSAFRKNKIWDFNGGIHPPEMKTQSNGTPLRQVPLAQRFVIPLKQHIGAEGELCVSVGDKVLRGQPLPVDAANAASSRAHLGYRYGYCAPLYGSSFSFS